MTGMDAKNLEREIEALDRQRFRAMEAGDVEALGRLLHEKLTYTHSSGVVDTKQSYLDGVRGKLWDYRKVGDTERRTSIVDGAVLVLSRFEAELFVRGVAKTVDSLALTVWVREGGRWQVAAVHSMAHPRT
jgi:hypothetical protein